jgi:hypothetical protein
MSVVCRKQQQQQQQAQTTQPQQRMLQSLLTAGMLSTLSEAAYNVLYAYSSLYVAKYALCTLLSYLGPAYRSNTIVT